MRAAGINPEPGVKRIRKNKYIPHLAAARFRPTEDWSKMEAEKLFQAPWTDEIDRIHYSDNIEGMKKLQDESIDCVIADPPFGLSFTGKESIYNRDRRFVRNGYREIKNDYEKFSETWIRELPRVMKKTATAWIFSGWTNLFDILNALKKTDLLLINHIIWRYQFGVFTDRKFVTSHYHLLFLAKSRDYYFNKVMHYPLDVWEINRTYRKGEVKNATKLPNEVVQRCVDFSTRPGDLVMDPFMGNGTTALVAKGSFRHYVGFELNRAMKPVIDAALSSIELGEFYIPYSEREDELVKSARKKYGSMKSVS
ncbi:MAG TPA: site-specific DNA-methyltransferase [Nitrososphaerales archaeon]|nr:site-specific DNA-methyltransferase [Nitrososphaerales archaeon]